MKRTLLGITVALVGAVVTSEASILAKNVTQGRSPSSMVFPKHRMTSDTSDVNSDYPDYLRFVLEVGRSTDIRTAQALEQTYEKLRRADPQLAARFLRGLRFELVQRVELRGLPTKGLTNDNPQMRPWIAKYMRMWLREADEYLFRAYVAKRTRRA